MNQPPEWEELQEASPLEVVCARCGKAGTSATFIIEEGDEWECPPCWERCEAELRAYPPMVEGME